MKTLTPILVAVSLSLYGVYSLRRGKSSLYTLKVLFSFVAAGGTIGTVFLVLFGRQSLLYYKTFWALEFLYDLILLALAIELIWSMLPKQFAVWWSTFFVLLLGISVGASMPLRNQLGYLNIAIAADCTAGVVLAAICWYPRIQWTREHVLLTTATILTIVGNALPAWGWLNGLSGSALRISVQLGQAVGLVVFVWAAVEADGKSKAVTV